MLFLYEGDNNMKDNKLLTIRVIISVIALVLVVAFCTYKMIFNKLEDNNTNVQENNKTENNNEKQKELIERHEKSKKYYKTIDIPLI